MKHLHALERAIVSEQQQLMQMKLQQQRVLDACRAIRKGCGAAIDSKQEAMAEERQFQADMKELQRRILQTKVPLSQGIALTRMCTSS